MSSIFQRPELAESMANQLLNPGVLDEGLRSGLFLSGLRRTGKTTFLRNDLIPALEEAGALVIYVDLWSDTLANPATLVHNAICKTLKELQTPGSSVLEICKVQGLTVVLLFLFAPRLLEWIGISSYYLPLFYIDLIGVSIQVVFMALLNVFFYLDKRRVVLELCVLFAVLNGALTLLSMHLGPSFFGYGFTLSLLVCVLLGLARLSSTLEDLEYETFMLAR